MAGNYEGGIKTRDKLLSEDPDFYNKLAPRGGKVKNPKKGFGSNKELAREAGRKGGQARRANREQNIQNNSKNNLSYWAIICAIFNTHTSFVWPVGACTSCDRGWWVLSIWICQSGGIMIKIADIDAPVFLREHNGQFVDRIEYWLIQAKIVQQKPKSEWGEK